MRFHKILSFVLTSITAGLAAALVVFVLRPDLLERTPQPDPEPIKTPTPVPGLPAVTGPGSFADAVARAAPSVVNIYTAKVTTERNTLLFKDPLLQRYFGSLLPEQTRERLETSLGSGVIFSPAGYVLTNFHIIDGADEINVVLANGDTVDVAIVGSDPETDLAVLKINADRLPVIPLGSSRAIRVGDVVLTIGNPFGVGQTVTMGIVSATGRSHLGINTYEDFIQTDAAINPGNSGGALINVRGELIGINTAIFSQSGGSHGIGFAIPVDLAKGVLEEIIRFGRVVRGWLGITGQDITPRVAESFALRQTSGVLVSGVLEDGPADRAGIRPGDVIARINGRAPADIRDVLDMIAKEKPGTELKIEGWRGNDPLKVTAVTTERPAQVVRRNR